MVQQPVCLKKTIAKKLLPWFAYSKFVTSGITVLQIHSCLILKMAVCSRLYPHIWLNLFINILFKNTNTQTSILMMTTTTHTARNSTGISTLPVHQYITVTIFNH
jgi:hypothetical protein